MPPSPRRYALLAALALALSAACACSHEPPAVPGGLVLDLLARQPDASIELPGAIVPQGDVPGTTTWGASEGPGWSQADQQLADGTHYRETNQASASLILPATRPAARELELALWCARAAGAQPARVSLKLNGIELAGQGLELGREPVLVRVHAPEQAWLRGPNQLELSVRAQAGAWDTLALASVRYGAEARPSFDTPARSARFVDGTGARYALELADAAWLSFSGTTDGAGVLLVRTGTLDPQSGQVTLDQQAGEDVPSFTAEEQRIEGKVVLTRPARGARVVELEWFAPSGAALVLHELRAREGASPPRPPIVFVSIDTFAAQHLALYGYGRATTPELERLCADAVLFERCLANAPWTLPSYLSVMSGLYPRAHWVALDFQQDARIQSFDQFSLAPNRWTIAEALRARGYRTAGFVDTQWLSPQTGVAQGFDLYDGQAAIAPFSDVHAGIELIVEHLVAPWLATTAAERPPFLFVHALDAHGPYLPEAPFRDRFLASLQGERTLVSSGSLNQTYRTIPKWMGLTLVPGEHTPLPERQPVEELIARYDETLLKVDAYLGKLFALLRAQGLYDQAVIVITGDHGEFFGPGVFGHGVMREAVLHVPLLLKLPRNAHGGLHVRRPVALVDVYPTLLELAGVPADPERLHGRSLLPLLAADAQRDERAHFSEGGHVEQYALTLGRWRLVEERPGSESGEASLLTHPRVPDDWLARNCPELLARPLNEALLGELTTRPGFAEKVRGLRQLLAGPYYSLYDSQADPGDLRDLSAEQPELVARMKPLLEAEKQRSLRARAEADPLLAHLPFTPSALEALEALGYGGGKAEPDADEDSAPGAPR